MVDLPLTLKGEITADGRLVVELPPDTAPGPVNVQLTAWAEPTDFDAEIDTAIAALLSPEALRRPGKTAAETLEALEDVSEDVFSHVMDSAAYVEEMRRKVAQRHQWRE